jgi:hypothetical protein
MAVSSIGGTRISALVGDAHRSSLRTPQQAGSDTWPDNRDAMRIEVSPAGRLASATNAVQVATVDAALSADFLASGEGIDLLSALLPVSRLNRRA